MSWLFPLLRPLLFCLDPESAHELLTGAAVHLAASPWGEPLARRFLSHHSPRLRSEVAGLVFENPVGMAAGFDKTGELYPFLSRAGFGFVESGTFTQRAQVGNPRPRLWRFPAQKALVNRMGFNNPGARRVAATLAQQRRSVPRGISIGKSRIAALSDAAVDQGAALRELARFADYLALNVSSPNTPGLRSLQAGERLRELLESARAALDSALPAGVPRPPVFVKLAPDLDEAHFDAVVDAAEAGGAGGLILTNTTIEKSAVTGAAARDGGLSGAPLRSRSTALIRRAYRRLGGRLPLIGVGGIFSGPDALEKIRAGASLVQVYTGYVYRGPGLPREINRYLDQTCEREGVSIASLIGSAAEAS